MPKWNCSVLEMLFRSGRVDVTHWDDGWPVATISGTHSTNSGSSTSTRTAASRMSSPVMWQGERLKVHRVLYFNILDDRHKFNYQQWCQERDNAKRIVERYRGAIHDYNLQQKYFGSVKRLPSTAYGWRSRIGPLTGERALGYVDDTARGQEEQWVGKKIFVVPRPMWLCVSQRELDLLTPTSQDMIDPKSMSVRIAPVQDHFTSMWQPFANPEWSHQKYNPSNSMAARYRIKSIRMFKGEPDVDNLTRINNSFRGGKLKVQKVRWSSQVPMVHPEIVGPARLSMMHMYAHGMSDQEVLSEMRSQHGERTASGDWVYMNSPVSPDWIEHRAKIRKELYG